MYRKISIVFVITLLLSVMGLIYTHNQIYAEQLIKLSKAEKEWIKKHPKVVVGFDPEWPPFDMLKKDGTFEGISSEYLKILEKQSGLKFNPYQSKSWYETVEDAKQKKVDMLTSIIYTEERTKYFNFTKSYIHVPLVLISKKKTPFVHGLDDLKGKKIVLIKSFISSEEMRKDYPDYDYIYRDSAVEALEAIVSGDADFFLTNLTFVSYYRNQRGHTDIKVAAETPYYFDLRFAVRKDWPELVVILDKMLDTITPEERKEIINKWIYFHAHSHIDYRLVQVVIFSLVTVIIVIIGWLLIVRREKEQIKKSEEKFRSMIERLREGYYFYSKDSDGILTYVSPTSFNLLDCEEKDLYTHYSTFMFDSPINEHSDYCARESLKGNVQPPFEVELMRKDGKVITFEISEIPIFDKAGNVIGAEGIAHDITEQKKKEQALKESEERFRSITANIPEIVYRCLNDEDRTMVFVNDAIQEITGYPAEDFINSNKRSYNDIIFIEDREKTYKIVSSALSQKQTFSNEYRIVTKDSKIKWVYEKGVGVFDEYGSVKYIDGFIIDLTHKKTLEEALKEQNKRLLETQKKLDKFVEELEIKNMQLEDANDHKNKFLSHMSHELRTPLNAIIGFSDVLNKKFFGDLNSRQEEYVSLILNSSNHLLSLINDMLDISKIDSGSAELNIAKFSFNELVSEVSKIMEPHFESKDITYHVIENDEIVEILGDRLKYKQILMNLLSNAVKYNKQEGSINLGFEKVLDNKMKVSIIDTGIGISEELQDKVFDEFYQIKNDTLDPVRGTGIGLALTKRLVELHNGTIGVKCKVDEGCHFWFEVPLYIE